LGSTVCTVSGLTNGTSYSIVVQAINVAGTGPASSPVSATPRTVPSAPQNLTAVPHRSKGVNLTWAAPASNGGAVVTNYRIYRGTVSGSLTELTLLGNVTSYRDAGTTKGVLYYYVVRAVNAAGDGPASSEASAIAK
jgi:fibronectin type 3 domain-containing protein